MGRAVGVPTIGGSGLIVITLNKILGAAGVVLLLGGALLGLRSVSAAGADCGSAFQPAGGITPMACDNALNSAATLAAVVIGAGVLCLIAAVTIKVVRDRARAKVTA
jgi:multisubunit Na+/H+ antiporter MnhC subunit